MKHFLISLTAVLVLGVSASAQGPDFSGKWVLDLSQSNLDARSRIESMTVTIEHKDQSFVRNTERKDAPAPEGRPGMGGRGGAFAVGAGREEYTLDGKGKKSSMESPLGLIPVVTVAKRGKDGSVTIETSRSFSSPMGEVTVTIVEKMSLSADGSTMRLVIDNRGPRPSVSEMVFKKS